jgi:hypothetical protein
MHRTFESSSSKTPHPSSSLHDDGEDDFERLLRLSLVSREDDEEVLNEEGKGARRRAGAQRRISRDDDDDVARPARRTVFQTPKCGLYECTRQTALERDVTYREMHFFFARRRARI